jgi:hypothetical protein
MTKTQGSGNLMAIGSELVRARRWESGVHA